MAQSCESETEARLLLNSIVLQCDLCCAAVKEKGFLKLGVGNRLLEVCELEKKAVLIKIYYLYCFFIAYISI